MKKNIIILMLNVKIINLEIGIIHIYNKFA